MVLNFHKIDVKVVQAENPPPFFLGSALRGAFGHALKNVSCIDENKQCSACLYTHKCPYYLFYEEKNCSHMYRFSKGLNEDNYNFSLYLFEEACEYLPIIDESLRYMLENQGLHAHRETFAISSLTCNGVDINDVALPITFAPDRIDSKARVNFVTPLRIKYKGHLLREKPTLETLLASVYFRLGEIKNFPMTRTAPKPHYIEQKSYIKFQDLSRFSNRQDTKMQLGGIVGYVEYSQLDERSFMLLKLAEIIGLGKQTVFGLGEIKVL